MDKGEVIYWPDDTHWTPMGIDVAARESTGPSTCPPLASTRRRRTEGHRPSASIAIPWLDFCTTASVISRLEDADYTGHSLGTPRAELAGSWR